ncbi:uncharacterized protein EHS24_001975 [Apiotrichum porosum]|uniref:Uncharacterized protein n=1 Tax=Apiotrichum porosum TaxID=105984 RepID=A0A427XJW5_9TREE|nr:uncharacterized protein EHS24_001975 [Apiotrichum porosum]RSH79047.1 hypothetical protein EHS24_001975 [Apiotrichum porosum]
MEASCLPHSHSALTPIPITRPSRPTSIVESECNTNETLSDGEGNNRIIVMGPMDLTSIHPVLNDHPSPPTMSLVSIPHLLGESRAYSPDDEYLNLADLSLDDLDLSDVNLLDDEEDDEDALSVHTIKVRFLCEDGDRRKIKFWSSANIQEALAQYAAKRQMDSRA